VLPTQAHHSITQDTQQVNCDAVNVPTELTHVRVQPPDRKVADRKAREKKEAGLMLSAWVQLTGSCWTVTVPPWRGRVWLIAAM
jgi:hypothetical protein